MWGAVFKAIPWKKIVPFAMAAAGTGVGEWLERNRQGKQDPTSPKEDIASLTNRIAKLEDALELSATEIRKKNEENQQLLKDLSAATEILASRVAVALIFSTLSLIIGVICLIKVLAH